ncbi:MAG: Rap1a/Tai family immunity protein [Pseudomonadota bacterium]
MTGPVSSICVSALLIAALSVVPAAAAPVTVGEVKDLKARAKAGAFSARAEWNALTYYLQGVVEGAVSYHKALNDSGGETLFCPPQGATNSLDELIAALDAAGLKAKHRPVTALVTELYVKKYPCNG